jgi:glycosyltransferase involved in cell wall biosynthesis
MRVVGILASYNEERFIAGCLEHLFQQGVEVYLCDNESTDQTVAIAECFLGQGLIGIQTIRRAGMFSLRTQLARKEQLGATLDADWFMHADADEIRLPPRSNRTLAEALADADGQGLRPHAPRRGFYPRNPCGPPLGTDEAGVSIRLVV